MYRVVHSSSARLATLDQVLHARITIRLLLLRVHPPPSGGYVRTERKFSLD